MPESSFINSSYEQPIFDVALSIGCYREHNLLASGTAVIIAPNLAITAKHVVEDFMKKFDRIGSNRVSDKIDVTFNLVAVQYQEGGNKACLWRAKEIYFCMQSDIAFIYLLPFNIDAQTHEWSSCKLDLVPPKVGSQVYGFGFHSSKLIIKESDGESIFKWDTKPATTLGKVVEYHPIKRDNTRINFPCFQTNARFDGGMSGGPVFNESGSLCGLICSTLLPSNDNEEHVSYVALLWPSMITQINIPYEELAGKTPYPLLLMAQMGYLKANGYEGITLENTQTGSWYDRISFLPPVSPR